MAIMMGVHPENNKPFTLGLRHTDQPKKGIEPNMSINNIELVFESMYNC
jgi:hypothetical protein